MAIYLNNKPVATGSTINHGTCTVILISYDIQVPSSSCGLRSHLEQPPPWKSRQVFHSPHIVKRKTQARRLHSGGSLGPETTFPRRTGSHHDDGARGLAESSCGLSELITVPSYAGVSFQGFYDFVKTVAVRMDCIST
ncbi:PREDICTED: talanin-like [Chrysochloris asiatica]|uniref:Talanin-like n=1 Tax=Chrysochloris asiatica TaxID=185453 RepID=A0A9B0TAB6_CHRAS|nr:PREDICTED: talanin-like [Chrysochloris asiatica]